MPWYYVVDKQTEGPVSEMDLGEKLRSGVITGNTFVWNNKKAKDWVQMCKVDGLLERLQNPGKKRAKRGAEKDRKAKGSKYSVGDSLYVKIDETSVEKAKVTKVNDKEIKIHYILFSSSYDEWIPVDSDRIQDKRSIRRSSSSLARSNSAREKSRKSGRSHSRALSSTSGMSYSSQREGRSRLTGLDEENFRGKRRSLTGGLDRKSGRGNLESERIYFEAEKQAFEKIKQDFFTNRFTLEEFIKVSPGQEVDLNHELLLENKTLKILKSDLQRERDELKVANDASKQELEERERQLELEKSSLDEAREALQKDRNTLRRKLIDLQQVAADRKTLRQLKREIKANREKLEQQNNYLAMQEGDTNQRAQELEQKLVSITAERDDLEMHQATIEAEKEMLERSREEFNKERHTLMRAHEIFKKERKELDEEKGRLREEITRLKRREEQKQQEMETKLLALDKEKAQVLLEKEKMTNIVKEQISQMKNEFNLAREKQLADEQHIKKQKSEFEEEIQKLQQENRVLLVEKQGIRQQMNALQAQVSNSNDNRGTKFHEISEKVLDLTSECTKLQVQNATLTQELSSTRGELQSKVRELEMKQTMISMKAQREELTRQQISDLRNEVTTLQVQKDLLDNNYKRNLAELTKVQNKYEDLKVAHDRLKEDKLRSEHRVEVLTNRMTVLEEQLDDFEPPPLPAFTSPTANTPAASAQAGATTPSWETAASGAQPLQRNFDDLMSQILSDRKKFAAEEDAMQQNMASLMVGVDDSTGTS